MRNAKIRHCSFYIYILPANHLGMFKPFFFFPINTYHQKSQRSSFLYSPPLYVTYLNVLVENCMCREIVILDNKSLECRLMTGEESHFRDEGRKEERTTSKKQ